ncbi:MAG TPA: hypothetical protein PLD96_03165 [Methanothrix sp.]|nr:hypothetical protein [Methanothrix sp.]HPM26316.1 hypothetical protein [Methanothrix sp.]
MPRPNEPEAFKTGRLENVTIRTINSLLGAGLRELGVSVERTIAVLGNGVSAAKPSGWTNEDKDHAIKNLKEMRAYWCTQIDAAISVAERAGDMQVQKSEMDGVGGYGGSGAD